MDINEKDLRLHSQRLQDAVLTALTATFGILMFIVAPLQATGLVAAHYFAIAFAFVLAAAVYIVSSSAAAVAAILLAIGLIVIATVARLYSPSVLDLYLDTSAWVIAGTTLSVVVARAVFAPGRVTFHRLLGAILLYLDIGFIFAALFSLTALTSAGAFTGIAPMQDDLATAATWIYFSLVTLTSVGYGDIAPVHPLARSLANIEAIIGQLYPATLLARLVTLELESRRDR